MFRLEPASPEVIEVPDTGICGVCGSWLQTEFKQVRKCSHYTVQSFKRQNWLPPSPLSPRRATVCVCVPPETNNFNPNLSFYFFIRIQRTDPFCKLKSQIFISPFLGMSHRRWCHQSPQDGHHYNDLLCRTDRELKK